MAKRLSLLCIGLLFVSLVSAGGLQIENGTVFLGVSNFDLVVNGEKQGYWRYETRLEGDTLIVTDETAWLTENIIENIIVTVNSNTYLPKSLEVDGDFNGSIFKANLVWDDGVVSGSFTTHAATDMEEKRTPFESMDHSAAYERTSVFGLLSASTLLPGETFTFTWFNVFVRDVEEIPATVGEATVVSTPHGEYEALPVTIQSPTQSNVVYVTTTLPHRVVRVDVTGQPMIFVLSE